MKSIPEDCNAAAAVQPDRRRAVAGIHAATGWDCIDVPPAHQVGAARDGQHDFDFSLGTWKTHLKRLVKPLSGSTTWVEYEGSTVVRKVWGGRANLAELEADGPGGHFQVLSLRLYDPVARQWSLNAANSTTGKLGTPTIGEFRDGRGEFYDHEDFNGRRSSCEACGRISPVIRSVSSSPSRTMAARRGS